jgi:hypothetical protein
VDLAWASMVGITWEANSSNSSSVKFIIDLNNASVAHIIPRTSWTPRVGLIDRPPSFFHLMWIEQIISVGSHCCHHLKNDKVILTHKRSSSLEDEVALSLIEELEEDISQGLKWKQERKKKKTYSLYSPTWESYSTF